MNYSKNNYSSYVNLMSHFPIWAKWIILSCSMLLTCLMFIPFSPWMPTDGLDPSWMYAVNQAVEQGLVFGRDFVFTYGPFGYVHTQQYSPGTDFRMLLMSAIFILGFVISIYLNVPRSRQWLLVFLPFVFSAVSRESIFLVFPFFLLMAVARINLPSSHSLYLPVTAARIFALSISVYALGMLPIIKGNFLGTVLPVSGVVFLLLWFKEKEFALWFLGFLAASMYVNWMISGQELKHIFQYFVAMRPIISGYTNAMSISGEWFSIVYILFAISIFLWVFSRSISHVSGWRAWSLFFGAAFTLFVSFKSGFVRQDGHVSATLGALLLLLFLTSFYAKWWKIIALFFVIWAGFSLVYESKSSLTLSYVKTTMARQLSATWTGIMDRIYHPEKRLERYERAKENIRKKHPLPAVIGTVDIYPIELSTLFAHDLKWSGRPVPQSYSVYTSSLDAMNSAHLRSQKAPETVFFRFRTIDNRLPMKQDASSILELISRYTISEIRNPYVVLERSENAHKVSLDYGSQRTVEAEFGKSIELNSERPAWMQAKIRPTFLGRLATILLKSTSVNLEIVLDNGRILNQRIIVDISKSGFIVSPYISSAEEFSFMAAGGKLNSNVKSVRFLANKSGFWRNDFSVKIIPIDIVRQKNLPASIFSSEVKKSELSEIEVSHEKASCHLDYVNGMRAKNSTNLRSEDGFLKMKGWTAPPARENDNQPIQALAVVQTSNGENLTFKANMVMRSDVVKHFNRTGLETSGYEFSLDLSNIQGEKKIQIQSVSGGIAYNCPSVISVN